MEDKITRARNQLEDILREKLSQPVNSLQDFYRNVYAIECAVKGYRRGMENSSDVVPTIYANETVSFSQGAEVTCFMADLKDIFNHMDEFEERNSNHTMAGVVRSLKAQFPAMRTAIRKSYENDYPQLPFANN